MPFRLLFLRVWAGVGAIQPESIYIARGRYCWRGEETRTAEADTLDSEVIFTAVLALPAAPATANFVVFRFTNRIDHPTTSTGDVAIAKSSYTRVLVCATFR